MSPASAPHAEFCPQCCAPVPSSTSPSCPACAFGRPGRGWPADPYIGRLIDGKYRIERRLGAGGMGMVVLATQVHDDIEIGPVVLKFLHAQMAENSSIRSRFVNEARAARRISSPHVVKVFDFGFDTDGAPFMVMEYLTGTSLQSRIDKGPPLSRRAAVHVAMQIAEALKDCHAEQILHRDLKPDNVLLQEQMAGEFVKIIDFGIAKVPRPDGQATQTLMGTPRYMAPEQLLMKDLDGRVDIYALGVILFEMLTGGCAPIEADSPAAYMIKTVSVVPPPLTDLVPDTPAPLTDLVARMLAKEPAARPATMGDVFHELAAFAEASGWKGRGSDVLVSGGVRIAEVVAPPSASMFLAESLRMRRAPAWRRWTVVAAVLAAAVAGAAWFWPRSGGGGDHAPDPRLDAGGRLDAGRAVFDGAPRRDAGVAPDPDSGPVPPPPPVFKLAVVATEPHTDVYIDGEGPLGQAGPGHPFFVRRKMGNTVQVECSNGSKRLGSCPQRVRVRREGQTFRCQLVPIAQRRCATP